MDHPHIVKAFEVYKYKKQIYLILECCDGGDLYTRSPYSERQAAKMVNALLSAIRYMHENKIVHRDVRVSYCVVDVVVPKTTVCWKDVVVPARMHIAMCRLTLCSITFSIVIYP